MPNDGDIIIDTNEWFIISPPDIDLRCFPDISINTLNTENCNDNYDGTLITLTQTGSYDEVLASNLPAQYILVSYLEID